LRNVRGLGAPYRGAADRERFIGTRAQQCFGTCVFSGKLNQEVIGGGRALRSSTFKVWVGFQGVLFRLESICKNAASAPALVGAAKLRWYQRLGKWLATWRIQGRRRGSKSRRSPKVAVPRVLNARADPVSPAAAECRLVTGERAHRSRAAIQGVDRRDS
jgi:hypothetical protein